MAQTQAEQAREHIAALKEERSRLILQFAQDDDSTTGADHPDVLAKEAEIKEAQAAFRRTFPEEVQTSDTTSDLIGLRTQQVEEGTRILANLPADHPNRAYFERVIPQWERELRQLTALQ